MTHKSVKHLLQAIDQGHLKKIIYLIKHGYNIYVKNTLKQNLLVYILQQQSYQQDSSLIKKRFQIFEYFISNYNFDIHSFDSYGKNLFNWATNLNCTQEAIYLLNSYPGDIDILTRDQYGSCSLHYAVEHGNDTLVHAIVNYLLRYRLRFDIKDAYNYTPEDLARKFGYDKICHFLIQACRSTIYMSREIPLQQSLPPLPNKTKIVTTSSSVLSVSSEYFNVLETRIHNAKNSDDWKTVAALRAFKRNIHDKFPNRIPDNILHSDIKISSIPSLPPISSTNNTSQSNSPPEQMLRLFETQMSPSFRQPFIPIYQQSIMSTIVPQRTPNGQNKNPPISSAQMSTILNLRKRDSDTSQGSNLGLQDIQNQVSMPSAYKQRRQSAVPAN
ncbi:unnamed protein product [Adineta steineri]|uniref:Uncharacterized protein n=1 Tax=Adineta steineri TaxID=433720 RepID=A0A818TIZ1_9BILA|nr:unnamed protein product [Adineta steineri]CAF3678280.1 unnamed protein product [Adineta steineri]